jgi:hypothetical protein
LRYHTAHAVALSLGEEEETERKRERKREEGAGKEGAGKGKYESDRKSKTYLQDTLYSERNLPQDTCQTNTDGIFAVLTLCSRAGGQEGTDADNRLRRFAPKPRLQESFDLPP